VSEAGGLRPVSTKNSTADWMRWSDWIVKNEQARKT
jgi:hypothetical protein